MYLHICTNERHKCCILSMQKSEMLLYALYLCQWHYNIQHSWPLAKSCWRRGYCSLQSCRYLLLRIFYPGFCNLPSSLRGRLIYFTGITNSHMDFKLQTTNHSIVGGQYFNVPKPTEFWVDHIKLTQRFGSCMVKDPPSD